MIRYVLGFLFNEDKSRVLLIKKERPDWQKGFLNGIGGHIEDSETSLAAMNREFFEETSLSGMEWKKFGYMSGYDWDITLFVTQGQFLGVQSITDEEVINCKTESILLTGKFMKIHCIPNLRWLIPMAINKLDGVDFGEHRVIVSE